MLAFGHFLTWFYGFWAYHYCRTRVMTAGCSLESTLFLTVCIISFGFFEYPSLMSINTQKNVVGGIKCLRLVIFELVFESGIGLITIVLRVGSGDR